MNVTSINSLQSISYLFQKKQSELQNIIANIKVDEVKNDDTFAETIKRIKEHILMKNVLFKDPFIKTFKQINKYLPPDFINPLGGYRDVYIITVEYPFEGNKEIFGFAPSCLNYSSTSYYFPYENSVSIDIETNELNKVFAFQRAKEEISTTLNIIHEANKDVSRWNIQTEQLIYELLKRKKEELISFYK